MSQYLSVVSAHSRHSINNYTDLTISWERHRARTRPGSSILLFRWCYDTLLRSYDDSGGDRHDTRRDSESQVSSSMSRCVSPPVHLCWSLFDWLPAELLPILASHWLSGSLKRSYWDLIGREFNKITTGFCFLSLLKWCWKRLATTATAVGAHKIILKFIEIYYCWCQKHSDNKRKCHNKDQNLSNN